MLIHFLSAWVECSFLHYVSDHQPDGDARHIDPVMTKTVWEDYMHWCVVEEKQVGVPVYFAVMYMYPHFCF